MGIAAVEGENLRITSLVEKPKPADAPSNLSVVGRYIFTPKIIELLRDTQPGAGGEIQLTDAMAELLEQEEMFGYMFDGKSYDCGDKLGYLEANVDYALRNETLGDDFKVWLKQRCETL